MRKILSNRLTGRQLIDDPLLNKGTAFSEEERSRLRLHGLLPPHVETLEEQVTRAYEAYRQKTTDIERHIYLRALQDTNETLFYRLVVDHLTEMTPIIYTPVVGEACKQFSHIYRRPRGLCLSYPHRDRIEEMLRNYGSEEVRVIVVTDGERILGLGDQGAGGMGIPIGKLSLYVACGGIHPCKTLPILLDVGTNNAKLLEDPHYIGWRHERITGQGYLDFVDAFVESVKAVWPQVLLQFEDFAINRATSLLERYRDQLCMFNDDVQGTGSACLGTLLAAVEATGARLADQTVAVLGGGSAGSGIAEQIIAVMVEQGVPIAEAIARIYVIDRTGLLHDGMRDLLPFQRNLAHPEESLKSWSRSGEDGGITLMDVMKNVKPTVLIGVSGQAELFTREIVREMASHVKRPIIFPLSNPTSNMEAVPSDLIEWTEGRALVATGSPMEPVSYKGRSYPIAQCNNIYIFPAIGLGVLAAGVRRVTDEMLRAAARALSECSPALHDAKASLLPPLGDIRQVSKHVAFALAMEAQRQGHTDSTTAEQLRGLIDGEFWEPGYRSGQD